MAGVLAGAGVLTIGASFGLGGIYFAATGAGLPLGLTCPADECGELEVEDPARVDPTVVIERARSFARSIDSSAELLNANVVLPIDRPTLDLREDDVAMTLLFQSSQRVVTVRVAGTRLWATVTKQKLAAPTFDLPGCSFKEAWAAAKAAGWGRHRTATAMLFSDGQAPAWLISDEESQTRIWLDAETCEGSELRARVNGVELWHRP